MNQTEQTHRKETLRAQVVDAASFIEDEGEKAFSEFRQEETKWSHNDTYLFVWRTNGIRVVYPPDPAVKAKT